MCVGNPRSLSGCDLRATPFGCARKVGRLPFWLSVAGVFLSASLGFAQEKRAPGGALDAAEVEPFHFSEPGPDLFLDDEGVRKRKAMIAFYRGISLEATDIKAALEYFKQVLELDPSNVGLAMETATHSAVFGKFSEALAILEGSLGQNPGNRDAYLNLSRYCDAHHNNDENLKSRAVEYAETALAKFPADEVVIEHLVALLESRKNKERAVEVMEAALGREVSRGEYWLALGHVARQVWPLRNDENRQRVFGVFEKALRADPENLGMVEKVAQFFKSSGNIARAIQIYEILVRRSPDRLRARESLAELYWAADRKPDAIKALESLVRINPLDLRVRRKLSSYFEELGEIDKALGHSEAVLEFGAGSVDDHIALANLQLAADKVGGALQTLRQGVSVHPHSAPLLFALGRVYLSLDRFADSYASFKSFEKYADPKLLNEDFYFEYGATAERAGEFEAAERLLRKAIELVPEDAEEDKARSLNYLGYMWLEREENIDEAGEMIRQANELKPDNGAYLDSLGWFHYLKGEFDEAIKHLARAAELMEEDPDSVIFEHLARAHLAQGDRDEARRYAERALELEPERVELKKLQEAIEKAAAEKSDEVEDEEMPAGEGES